MRIHQLIQKLLSIKEREVKASIIRKINKIQTGTHKIYGESNRTQWLQEETRAMNPFLRLMLLRNIIGNWSKYTKRKKEDRLLGRSDSITPQQSLSASDYMANSRNSGDEPDSRRSINNPNNVYHARRPSYQS